MLTTIHSNTLKHTCLRGLQPQLVSTLCLVCEGLSSVSQSSLLSALDPGGTKDSSVSTIRRPETALHVH